MPLNDLTILPAADGKTAVKRVTALLICHVERLIRRLDGVPHIDGDDELW